MHTPGKWELKDRYDLRHNPCGIDIAVNSNTMICRMPDGATVNGGNAFPEQLANARLIAAAPDMYEACKSAISEIEYMADKLGNDHKMTLSWELLRDALSKAEGK